MQELSRFIARIDEVRARLKVQSELILESTENPELLFDQASKYFPSAKETIFNIMDVYEDGQRKMNAYELQEKMLQIINEFFKQQLGDTTVEVRTRKEKAFPSLFAIYKDDVELIQFDIFKRFYGKRTVKSKEDIEQKYIQLYLYYMSERQIFEEKISEYNSFLTEPYKYIIDYQKNRNTELFKKLWRGAKEVIEYSFASAKYKTAANKEIQRLENKLELIENSYAKMNKRSEEIDLLESTKDLIITLEDIFIKYDYRLETEQYKLY